MHGRADLKAFMLNELDIMNYLNHKKLIRLHDAFEASDLLIIVMELYPFLIYIITTEIIYLRLVP